MSEFVSVLDILAEPSYEKQRQLKEEVALMDFQLRRAMDEGLSPEDMKKAQAGRHAAHAASTIFEKIFS